MKLVFGVAFVWVALAGSVLLLVLGAKSASGEVQPLDLRPVSPRLITQVERSDGVRCLALSDDGKWLVTGGWDKSARLWDLSSGQEMRNFQDHYMWVSSVALSGDGKRLITASAEVALWEVSTGRKLRSHSGPYSSTSAAISSDDKFLFLGCNDEKARLLDVSSGQEMRSFRGHTGTVHCVALSQDNKWLFTGSGDNTARLWEVVSGREVRSFRGHRSGVRSLAVSRDGKMLVTGSYDETSRLWDVSSGKTVRSFRDHTGWVLSVAISHDGRRVATGSSDGTARLWEVATGQESHCFQGHSSYVNSVALSADAKWLFTGSADGTTRVWSLLGPHQGKEVCQLLSFRDGTWAVTDPEGRYDASNGGDIEHLHWVVGMETFPLKKFADRYYDPGLLAKHLGLHKERPREVGAEPR